MRTLNLPRGLTFLVAFGCGAVAGLAWEPTNWWPLLFAGLAGVTVLILRRDRGAFGIGYGFGLGLLAVTLNWLSVLVAGAGPLIAAALIAFEALFFGCFAVGLKVVSALRWWPVAAALGWSLTEFAYARVPFGGFGWTRLAYAMVDTPVAGLLPLIGVSGVSFGTAFLAFGLAWAYLRVRAFATWSGSPLARWRPLLAAVAVALAIVLLGLAGRAYQVEPAAGSGSVTVGMVQGNVDGVGVGGMGRARSVTNNHLSETVTLLAKARTGVIPRPDFVLWPENSTDIDPLLDVQTNRVVNSASELAGIPILVGAVMEGPGADERQTSGLWWQPGGQVSARYDKRNLVPFGEYIPFRSTLLPVIPLLKLVGAQSVPGSHPGVLATTLADGTPVRVGDVVCFELAYDKTVYQAVRGSEVLVVQSNNATYRGTAQIRQQFAITRVRAMEARRDIAVSTTNSVSGLIDRNGVVRDRTQEMTSASNAYAMPRRQAVTPGVLAGEAITWVLAGLAVAVLGYAVLRRRRGH